MPSHHLTNFEIPKYYQNEPRFNSVYSRVNLPRENKRWEYTINHDEYTDVDAHWIALYCKNIEIIILTVSELNMFLRKLKKHKIIKTNIFAMQSKNSIMYGYFCTGFIDFMFAGKTLIDFTSLFSSYDFEKNKNIILSYFKND